MDADIVWTTLLNPRFSLKSCHWQDEDEKSTVKNFLMENLKQVALDESYALSSSMGNEDTTRTDDGLEDENAIRMFESDATNHYNHQSTISTREKAKVHAKQEVLSYLICTGSIVKRKFNPLEWWQVHKNKYPNVAVLARKWLSVLGTLTPSERVFSICGLVNTAKRSRLSGKSIQNQVFIHNNKSLIN